MSAEPNGPVQPDTALRNPRLWIGPTVVVTLLMSLLAVLYLGSVLDPQKHLHDFRLALVNQDEGETMPGADGGEKQNFGDQIAKGIVDGVPKEKVDLQQLSIAEATTRLQDGQLFGAIVIPSDFSKRLLILAQASVVAGDVERPVITVQTNPRTGAFATAIVTRITDEALAQVNQTVGKQLSDQVKAELAKGPQPTPLAGASQLTLNEPVQVVVAPFHPLPDGTGNGLSAFFYTIMVLLAGFTGAMIVHQLVDSMLGFAPTEYGPWYVHYPSVGISRFHTLLVKWTIMFVVASIVSAVYLVIGHIIGMPIDRWLALFLYSAFAITAVGVTALSVLAALGSAGMLVNLVVFIVLGLPSSGGTIPIEATPKFFGWLARFEPMHQVFLGVRSILYFNASGDSGIVSAVWMTVLGLAIGLVLGVVVTRVYDRKGLERKVKSA